MNINTDREFGLALLRFLAEEMRRRAEAAKAYEVTKLEELRAADPDGRWPRIVADRRRVPVPVRRARRGHQGRDRAAGGRRPARALAGHPPGAGQPGRLGDRGVLGPAGDLRAVRAADRAARGRAASSPTSTTPRWACRAGTRWSTTSPGSGTGTRSCGSPTPPASTASSANCTRCTRPAGTAPASSTAAGLRGSPSWSPRSIRSTGNRVRCSGSASTWRAARRPSRCPRRRGATSA